ncbi:MAG: MarR family transcriptional regulator [Azospirillaceae bacterium]
MDDFPPRAAANANTDERAGARSTLRLWLRLLSCTNLVEGEIRRRLRRDFAVTLPRFDLMAQLATAPDGMTMGELSRGMMVSNGNVTGIADRLASEGLIVRQADANDKRTTRVRLTEDGRASFAAMAAVHHGWIRNLFDGLTPTEVEQLMALLAKLKRSVEEDAQAEDM